MLKLGEFMAKNNKNYEFEAIIDSTTYGQQVNNKMLGFYYVIL